MVHFVPRVRIAALAAGAAVLATAVGAVTVAARAPDAAPGTAASARLTAAAELPAPAGPAAGVRPDGIRPPGAVRAAPPTTSQCKQGLSVACYTPNQVRAAYRLPTLYARKITGRGVTIVIEDSYGSPTI